ncbi:VOC family protein [Maribacter litopenaei]|uniref:VOC family protein n=1 Tax=Maribacter litopenaei TaxID=2976127 RepID=A0ABY5Y9N0_9FLAO|nr:VOC family protein [Maribacter litopenaei]UWX54845.1 VOC family protein [Maribacter litopenaei]
MKIEHLALWVRDLELMRTFYEDYFGAVSGDKYVNPRKQFTSYFLSFDSGPRLELMHRADIADVGLTSVGENEFLGLIHFAISVGSKEKVDTLTAQLEKDSFKVIGAPRTTGDGYYESVVLDPEGNRIEITV